MIIWAALMNRALVALYNGEHTHGATALTPDRELLSFAAVRHNLGLSISLKDAALTRGQQQGPGDQTADLLISGRRALPPTHDDGLLFTCIDAFDPNSRVTRTLMTNTS